MNILALTDFSKNSDYAFDAACQLAILTAGTVHVYHSADIPDGWEEMTVEKKYKDHVNKSVAIAARDKMNLMCNEADGKGIKCKQHFTGGPLTNNIEDLLDELPIDLVVMGARGTGIIQSWVMGSNTKKVIRRIHKNVLVVKEDIGTLSLDKVVFASGLDLEDKEPFARFLSFIRPFNVKELHILAINTSSYFSQPVVMMRAALEKFKSVASDFNCTTHNYNDYSVPAGVRHFSDEYDIDLIAMSNHSRHPIKRIFQGSNVETVVQTCDKLVLTIDY